MIAGVGSAFFIALGWVLAGLLGSIPILLSFKWWSEGLIEGAEFFGLAFVFGLMFMLLMSPIPPVAKGVIFVFLACSSLGLPYIVAGISKKDAKTLDRQKEETYRDVIARNPGNAAARGELAQNLYSQGRKSEAIEEMERAVGLSPRTTEKEQYLLKAWLRERDEVPVPAMICRWCREETPKDRPVCVHCGQTTSSLKEVADSVKADFPSTLRSFLILLPFLVVGAFLVSSIGGILGNFMLLLIVAGGLLWFRTRLS